MGKTRAGAARQSLSPESPNPVVLDLMPFDPDRFENVHQVGGIQTGSLDHPQPNGGQGCRVAFVDTGAGLRFTVNLDRGGDIVAATYKDISLAFHTPNGYKPPNPAYHRDEDWLEGWPGGLVTTCGPEYIGPPRVEDGRLVSLHGRYSNTPAAIDMIHDPEPRAGRTEMLLSMIMRDSRFYGPVFKVRRQIQCQLGEPMLTIYDEVTNRSDLPVAHHWLYHCNFGYPLLDEGAKFIYKGTVTPWQPEDVRPSLSAIQKLKTVSAPRDDRRGGLSDAIFIDDSEPAEDGLRHVGLINTKRKLGVELSWPANVLPRLANWQHLGPMGAYVSALEPFSGSLRGKHEDDHPAAEQYLQPGQTRRYRLHIRVHEGTAAINALKKHDGPLELAEGR